MESRAGGRDDKLVGLYKYIGGKKNQLMCKIIERGFHAKDEMESMFRIPFFYNFEGLFYCFGIYEASLRKIGKNLEVQMEN